MLAFVVAVALLSVSACATPLLTSDGRYAARVALLLPEMLVDLPARPSALFAPEIVRESVAYEYDDAGGRAIIWRPTEGAHSGLILSLGVNPAPPDDPRVVRLCAGLARAGLAVMLLQSDALDADQVEPEEIDRMVAAFQWLEGQPFTGERIGMTGFSVGASLVTIAAADPRISDRVTLVNAFGGYADLRRLAIDAVSRSYIEDQVRVDWAPDELTVRLVREHIAAGIADESDRRTLLAALPGDRPPPAVMPPFRTDDARLVWSFLTAPSRDAATAAMARLPASILARLDVLSPATRLGGLRAKLYVMHDRSDAFVPVAEAELLASLARSRTEVHLTRFDLFEHVDLGGANPYVVARDSIKLFWHIRVVLAELQ